MVSESRAVTDYSSTLAWWLFRIDSAVDLVTHHVDWEKGSWSVETATITPTVPGIFLPLSRIILVVCYQVIQQQHQVYSLLRVRLGLYGNPALGCPMGHIYGTSTCNIADLDDFT